MDQVRESLSYHCFVLRVPIDADLITIKKSFRRAAHRYHPDANSPWRNAERFKDVVKSYRYLESYHTRPKPVGQPAVEKPVSTQYRNPVRTPFGDRFTHWLGSWIPSIAKEPRIMDDVGVNPKKTDPMVLSLSVSEMIYRLEHSDNHFVRIEACWAFMQKDRWKAYPILIRMLNDPDDQVRKEVISILGIMGSTAAIPHIRRFLTYPDAGVCCAAIRSIRRIGGAEADRIQAKIQSRRGILWKFWWWNSLDREDRLSLKGNSIPEIAFLTARFLHKKTNLSHFLLLKELGFKPNMAHR